MKKSLLFLGIFFLLISGLSCRKEKKEFNPITIPEIESHIRFLSDDLLEGRAVDSPGLALAALYHENYFRSLGLEPAWQDSFRQPLVLIGSQPDPDATMEVFSESSHMECLLGSEFVVNSQREDCPEGIEGELVYCGFLIQASEYDWDDIKETDLKGKVLLVEINEPGNSPGGIFEGEDLTFYGRSAYKFEKASELGAAGVLIIHNTKGAVYGWEVVKDSWVRESYFLPDVKNNLFFQGWLHEEKVKRILKTAGLDRKEMITKAAQKDFKPVPLHLRARVRQRSTFRSVKTDNVAAVLRGKHKQRKDLYVVLSAHYDHLGIDLSLQGDQIFNGAVDNCSASAVLLSLARYYSHRPQELKVNLVFTALTAEEIGLLGSDYFARHLPVSSSSVLANLNFEMTNVWGETEDVYAIGSKHSDLDEVCAQAASKIGLKYIPEKGGEFGNFFLSDQLSFARAGIPAVWLHEGITSKGKVKDYILQKSRQYRRSKYHQVTDEIEADWDLRGTIQIARWAQSIISELSKWDTLPEFKTYNSFQRK